MLTPPDDLTEDELAGALLHHWGVAATTIEYEAVGFGSHHWSVVAADGRRWFLTIDDLPARRRSHAESNVDAFSRLRAALVTARDLRAAGLDFVVAPSQTREGQPVVVLRDTFAGALYEHVDGTSFSWGDAQTPATRRALLHCIVALHAVPREVTPEVVEEDFTIPHRSALEAAVSGGGPAGSSPYVERTLELVAVHAHRIHGLLGRYDRLVATRRSRPIETVVTHGEPHPGNTMLTDAGLVLIDWETALAAPRERDLWMLAGDDPGISEAYAAATGFALEQATLDLYRTQWDAADLAAFVEQLLGADAITADAAQAFEELGALLAGLPR